MTGIRHLQPDEIARFVDDELGAEDLGLVWAHLERCQDCLQWVVAVIVTVGQPETDEERMALDRMGPVTMEDIRRKLRSV